MGKHTLGIDREHNPEFYELVDEHTSLIKRNNKINRKINNVPTGKFIPFLQKNVIGEIRSEIQEVNPEVNLWTNKVENFLLHPKLSFVRDQENELGYHHFMASLRDMRIRVNELFALNARNYEVLKNGYKNQRNYLIAISSFALSFGGLMWSLLGTSNIDFARSKLELSDINKINIVDSSGVEDTLDILPIDSSGLRTDSSKLKINGIGDRQ